MFEAVTGQLSRQFAATRWPLCRPEPTVTPRCRNVQESGWAVLATGIYHTMSRAGMRRHIDDLTGSQGVRGSNPLSSTPKGPA